MGEHDVGAVAEVPYGGLLGVAVAGHPFVVARHEGRLYAIGGICPHAGGKLADGVLHRGQVICPWHKAAFCLRSGRHSEPPALDDVAVARVRELNGRILLTLPDTSATRLDPLRLTERQDRRLFAIIGGGAAGAVAAQTLREAGFAGRVVMISQEDRLAYDRTLLSKYVLSGQQGGEKSPLQDEAFYLRHRIERLARTVTRVDAAARRLHFHDGATLDYEAALLATGAVPRRLDVPGGDLPGVFTLRGPDDALAILAAIGDGTPRVVVIGASFIGMEAAASLRERGLDVTVVAPQSAPFETILGAEVGSALRRLHERHGVAFRLGETVAAVAGDSAVTGVRLASGEVLNAGLVLAGLGVHPATRLLPDVAKRQDGGLVVDARLRVTEHLYAAGDIAAFPLRGDGPSVRVEHWRVAQQHGRVAALNMLGGDERYTAMPVFWTIQYLKRLDYIGHATSWDRVSLDGDADKPAFLAFYETAGRVAAVAGLDRDRQMAAAIGLLEDRRDWTVPALRAALRRVA